MPPMKRRMHYYGQDREDTYLNVSYKIAMTYEHDHVAIP